MASAARRELSLTAAGVMAVGLSAALFALLWLLREDDRARDPVMIAGGGFIANYRVSEIFAGFTAIAVKPVETGAILQADFADPAGGPPIRVSDRFRVRAPRMMLRTPALHGVEKGKPYAVTVRLLSRDGKREIWRHSMTFSSQVGSALIADKPLTIGPGYTPNPALKRE